MITVVYGGLFGWYDFIIESLFVFDLVAFSFCDAILRVFLLIYRVEYA